MSNFAFREGCKVKAVGCNVSLVFRFYSLYRGALIIDATCAAAREPSRAPCYLKADFYCLLDCRDIRGCSIMTYWIRRGPYTVLAWGAYSCLCPPQLLLTWLILVTAACCVTSDREFSLCAGERLLIEGDYRGDCCRNFLVNLRNPRKSIECLHL